MKPILTPYLLKRRQSAVANFMDGDVLDLGCGLGLMTKYLKPGQHYTGVEVSSQFIQYLTNHYPLFDFHRCNLDEEDLNLDRRFDTIIMVAVIEHLKNPERLLQQIPKHLKPNGKFVLTTPTPFGNKIHRLGAPLNLFSHEAMEEHVTIFDHARLQQAFSENSLELVYYQTFLWGGNQLGIGKDKSR
jgi:2-polyprenyl-3-methyl-5-hydroxy-6-metoxy-1,4-benzoquinol methylase